MSKDYGPNEPMEIRLEQRREENSDYISRREDKPKYAALAKELLGGSVKSETWADWKKLFEVCNKMEEVDLTRFLKDAELDKIAAKLEVVFLVDGAGFNKIRKQFSGAEYQKVWNIFFEVLRRRAGRSFFIDLARGGQLFVGLDMHGLTLKDLPEFSTCYGADMREAIITGHAKNIDWRGADLRGAHFDQTFFVQNQHFQGAKMDGVIFSECTGLCFEPEGLSPELERQVKNER